ncbi:MAG: GntR family transcriptional regulator [Bacteroidia bacterium]|jgi:GntR family transcriptional regulator|nr:GntR family transcriptional regulator [Bacteroidia bacterium]
MEFREKKAIYIQIAEHVCDQIMLKNWNPGEKLISIRELAASLEVNPNTVQRTYDLLQQLNIISNKRGVGYFIDTQAEDKIVSFRKEQFFKEELPQFLKTIYLLKIDIKEINDQYSNFIQDQKNK